VGLRPMVQNFVGHTDVLESMTCNIENGSLQGFFPIFES
jgi:hypothetical protein